MEKNIGQFIMNYTNKIISKFNRIIIEIIIINFNLKMSYLTKKFSDLLLLYSFFGNYEDIVKNINNILDINSIPSLSLICRIVLLKENLNINDISSLYNLCKLFLEKGANPNIKDNELGLLGSTPLGLLCRVGEKENIKIKNISDKIIKIIELLKIVENII